MSEITVASVEEPGTSMKDLFVIDIVYCYCVYSNLFQGMPRNGVSTNKIN